MKTVNDHQSSSVNTDATSGSASQGEKRTWEEPKLKFVTPKLTRHGKLERFTGGFFGTFSP